MEKKNPGQKRHERPRDVEDERADKGGLKTETKSQGLKSDANKLPEADPVDVEDEEEGDEE
ncbi:hypothetical protein BH10CYA1_BH10CYA1_09440 [soil metagenome]